MDYSRIYKEIIDNRIMLPLSKGIGYSEKHHILPKSLGGSDLKNNLVRLTAREHFLCHYLLVKIYKDDSIARAKMLNAFYNMRRNKNNRYINSRFYEFYKDEYSKLKSEQQSGSKNSNAGKQWIFNIELKSNKQIPKTEIIPNGWYLGRIDNWENFFELKEKVESGIRIKNLCSRNSGGLVFLKNLRDELNTTKKENRLLNLIPQVLEEYKLYSEIGFTKFCESTGYTKSLQCLIGRFKRYIPNEFKSSPGIKRDSEPINYNKIYNRHMVEYRCPECNTIFSLDYGLSHYKSRKTHKSITCSRPCGYKASKKSGSIIELRQYYHTGKINNYGKVI